MKKILILEDDLETLSQIFKVLSKLESELKLELSVSSFSEYLQSEELNKTSLHFDLIILDRDCKLAGSFHVLEFERMADKVIAISTQPEYNAAAISRGATKEIRKDYSRMEEFTHQLELEIRYEATN